MGIGTENRQKKEILKADESVLKDNGCNFFEYCLERLEKTPHNCTCMDPRYYFDKLEKTVDQCRVLEARRIAHKRYLKEEALIKTNQSKQQKDQPQEIKERKKTADAAEIYIRIFGESKADPLTDKEIADRLFSFTGVKPTNRNISTYRCKYNQGKLKGQINIPKDRALRHKKINKLQKQTISKKPSQKAVFKIKKSKAKYKGKKYD